MEGTRLSVPGDAFGHVALRAGVITREALDRAVAEQERQGGSLESILIAQGALEPDLALLVQESIQARKAG